MPNPDVSAASRLEKLEFSSSEVERRKTLLQLTITYPAIEPDHADLQLHSKEFRTSTLYMSTRESDANVFVQKTSRSKTTLVKLKKYFCEVYFETNLDYL